LEKLPQALQLHNNYAYSNYMVNPQKALEHWKIVTKLAKHHIGAFAGMAKYYFSNGDFENLVIAAKKIKEISLSTPVLKEMAHFCALARKYETAIDILNDYISQNPGDISALSKLSLYYAENNQFDAALLGLKQVLATKHKDAAINSNLQKIQQLLQQEQVVQ
jgi:tetratricopeptide (TPR) repeat protein